MAVPWKPLEPGALAVAHISDPHFGSPNAPAAWQRAADFLHSDVKPRLVLVTGDLVHTPNEENYALARTALDNLRLPYYVCAGNHDRFELGNRVQREFLTNIEDHPQGRRLIEAASRKVSRLAKWAAAAAGLVVSLLVGGGLSLAVGLVVGGLIGIIVGLVVAIVVAAAGPGLLAKRLKAWLYAHVDGFQVGRRNLLFDATFNGHLLSANLTLPVTLGDGAGAWDLGLLSLESSRDADYFARGKIATAELQPLKDATAGRRAGGGHAEFDLCVLLVHHHLLPVRALEQDREKNATDLVNATCLVNTGALLERLSESRVDVALHGHEHRHNWGSYESLEDGFAPVRVVAAGSVTGNDSHAGCLEQDAGFNVLILAPDRSVLVRRTLIEDGVWKQDRDADLVLYSAEQVRQSRARRRAFIDTGKVWAAYRSEIVKFIVFTRQRDVQMFWLWTNWKFKDAQVRHRVTNSTGVPVDPHVVLSGEAGTQEVKAAFRAVAGDGHAWNLEFAVPPKFKDTLVRVSVQYTWRGGGVLTAEELAALNHAGRLGLFRDSGFEFWTSSTNENTVAALEVHLSLPPEFAPAPVGGDPAVRVQVHEPGAGPERADEHAAESAALQNQLRSLAKGRYSLRVPFPRPNRDYTLCWKPAGAKAVDELLRGPIAGAGAEALTPVRCLELLTAFADPLRVPPFLGCTTFGLYVKSEDGRWANLHAYVSLTDADAAPLPQPPQTIHLNHERHLMVQAWWGATEKKNRPDDETEANHHGFEPDELALACVPLRFGVIGSPHLPPLAVVRIGIRAAPVMFANEMDDATIWRMLSLASSHLLAEWFRMR